jgi:dGTPase
LTKTTLASFLKYVRSPQEPRIDHGFRKKPGYFATEAEIVKQVWDEFGYSTPQRFPLAYVMEAADDIAYCISDLEDSFEKKIIDEQVTLPLIRDAYVKGGFKRISPCHREISDALKGIVNGRLRGKEFTYTDFRTKLNNALVHYAADQYMLHEDAIEAGVLNTLLPESDPPGYILKVLKDFCREHVYNHVSVQRVELAGYNAIFGLLEQFKPLLTASSSRFAACVQGRREDAEGKRILLEPKLLKLFPERYKKVYEFDRRRYRSIANAAFAEWILRAHLVVDFVSGMTDDFAMTTYRTLAGMEL